jgi:C1A family cysteine protease
VTNHNVRFAQGLETYQKGLNDFSDIPTKDFIAKYTGAKRPANGRILDEQESEMLFSSKSVGRQLPASFDWRTRGAVTPVKDQGQCG